MAQDNFKVSSFKFEFEYKFPVHMPFCREGGEESSFHQILKGVHNPPRFKTYCLFVFYYHELNH